MVFNNSNGGSNVRRNGGARRCKLSSQVTAQLESGIKLSLNHSCPPHCRGDDQNVVIYEPGFFKLQAYWTAIDVALNLNQHFNLLLETYIDGDYNRADFVAVMIEPDNKVTFRQSRLDPLCPADCIGLFIFDTIDFLCQLNLSCFLFKICLSLF